MIKARTRRIIQGSDYSAQEPRLLSQLCEDEGMLQAYRDGKDLYVEISSISFKRPYKMCLEHFPKGAPIKQCADGEHWEYAKLKTGEEDDIKNFEDFSKYLADDFDPNLYDYDKLSNGETDVFGEGKEYRSQAKRILLGIMYGRGARSIAEQLFGEPKDKKEEDENVKKAQVIKDNVYEAFPKIKVFEEESIKRVKDHGYVSTLWGRRRRLPNYNLPPIQMFYVYKDDAGNDKKLVDLSKVNPARYTEILSAYSMCKWGQREQFEKELEDKESIRLINNNSKIAAAGRQIINSQVQGSAADMSKMALIKIYLDEELRARKVKLIIPVHDEILIETPLRYAKYVKERFAEDMMTAARPKLTIPVSCDVESSDRWYGETMDLDEVLKDLEGA